MSQQAETILLDLPAAAHVLGVTLWTLRGIIARRELRVVKIGRKFFIRRASLLRFVERAECVA